MTYCIMQNTSKDLRQAIEKLQQDGFECLSDSEREYAIKLYKNCQRFIEVYEIEIKFINEMTKEL